MDSVDPLALARFWADLLTVPRDGTRVHAPELTLTFLPEDEPKTVKNRIHLDLASQSAGEQDETVSHALSLGASHADIGQGRTPWVVLRDPQGNEFCVLEPRPEYTATGPVAAIVVDALSPASQAAAWSAITGRRVARVTADFASLEGVGPWLEFVRVGEPKVFRNRVRLAVGGVLSADPEGNEFYGDG
ncbi:hypothetical protein SAMN05192558_103109 [Actinokineospora alba]|uniref:Glyoxalase-like domain-containing protein n=2 Tax=Actinokineospora alba TaxID=504798 RepID=A0A1H0JJC7_9PSEU|nr:hypothetical protein C8E96_3833 [Actinokineospora alba]SDH95536.1 hypothetical protein SAMN05421871_102940 [Actinokineospora alba]SDO43895.1 hypothetical protein SAMN05192558_103109 [Actinokineospora alba]